MPFYQAVCILRKQDRIIKGVQVWYSQQVRCPSTCTNSTYICRWPCSSLVFPLASIQTRTRNMKKKYSYLYGCGYQFHSMCIILISWVISGCVYAISPALLWFLVPFRSQIFDMFLMYYLTYSISAYFLSNSIGFYTVNC